MRHPYYGFTDDTFDNILQELATPVKARCIAIRTLNNSIQNSA